MADVLPVGHRWPDRSATIEPGALRAFLKATGAEATDPDIVPPTYLFTLDLFASAGSSMWVEDLQVDLAKVLHAEQGFAYARPVRAGETLTIESRLSDRYDKKGGALQFYARECLFRDAAGAEVAAMTTTLVVRHG